MKRFKNSCTKVHINVDEIWMNGGWFYTTRYANFGDGGKATECLPPDNLKRWIITQSKSFTRKDIEKVSKSK